jgi:hypothetical protein
MELISCGQLTGPLAARDVPLVMAAGLLPRYDWVRQSMKREAASRNC